MPISQLDKFSLHHVIMHHLLDHGFAPASNALASLFDVSHDEIARTLRALQDYHGVVLHPNNPEVWVMHPFCTAPTNFTVRLSERLWWGNCAWCSLGIAALLGGDGVRIETSFGAEGTPVTLHIDNGRVREPLLVHFPIAMTRVWENVIYSDSTVLVFESQSQIDAWAKRHNIPRGDVRPVQQVYDLGAAWYGRHLDRDWHKWTMAEAKEIFRKFELSGPIWHLPDSTDRF